MLFSPVDGNSLVRAAFGLRRFSSLLNHLRFGDKATRSARRARDVFAPIRELWDLFHTNLGKHYVAGQNITVDEQLVPFRGRCSFIQYMPSKPDKYGLKFFWASDAASNYPLRGFPYLGKEATSARPAERTMGIAARTVERLMQDFKGTSRNITYLSSIAARVIFQLKYPVDKLSHEDCRQRFNADVGRSMAYAHIVRRSTVPTLQKEVKDNISVVIKSIKPVSEQMAAKPPKRARVEESTPSAKKQKRCALCPAKRDRKTKSTCFSCDCHICQEHSVLFCQNCHAATS
ncbi:PiggyBac transposable element-derived protein 4-like protein [Plakobranchus ocellatus]|uniref:PiggyBac transposable element-derived protein 4-like protein n=1 Tax=Plakobranchus ocellatus TaxID=259542 RepID=A0AAV4D2L5_9GAST|nr:PiggyBac transposable element-derived protein 4-like protein [Plakobranchus ocellatus]